MWLDNRSIGYDRWNNEMNNEWWMMSKQSDQQFEPYFED
jgi:hypothetical protein